MPMRIRTRFAPSPTGFIHLGNLRSALYPWAFARSKGGDFILRIEDTDQERSSLEAVEVILEGMHWLEMDPDEGPIYQMQHMDRYREVLKQMLADGSAYYCYMSEDELNRLRDEQMANKQKPRYNGFWRPESGKTLPTPPKDVNPVIRFKNPIGGSVIWNDAVKGMIEISNEELDDLIIARPDGTPTYNFCVVVDDLDMKITHVIRGDDHVNNTPRQINIMKSLGGTPPVYAHLPTVLDESGEKMSKRNGALSVRDYQKKGYLPEAILNYLARLGWSHGDVEIFSKDQFIGWFDLEHLGRSPAQHNPEKLLWLNHHYIQNGDPKRLAQLCKPFADQQSINIAQGPNFEAVVALLKDRANTLLEIVEGAKLFYQDRPQLSSQQIQENIPENIRPAITEFREALKTQEAQSKEQVGALLKTILTQHNLKMPALAMPIRYALFATTQTPALDAVIAVLGKEEVIERLAKIG
ncbi:glutamate--tRNA ligase [Polynucleobacter sp. UK-FUSCHL-C3]|uniref:Glutamate--tRNA ligase n=1 Tax=Polynucleobacter sp. UK-FUSCHL-C3 TaxID=2955208 RepID=A0AAU8A5X0_9BURK